MARGGHGFLLYLLKEIGSKTTKMENSRLIYSRWYACHHCWRTRRTTGVSSNRRPPVRAERDEPSGTLVRGCSPSHVRGF